MQRQRSREQRDASADAQFRDERRGTIVGADRRKREHRRRRLTARAREWNDVAEIGCVGLRRLIAARNQDSAVEVVGTALIVRSRGDDVAWLRKLSHRHPFLKKLSPKRTFNEPLNVIPGLGDGTRLFDRLCAQIKIAHVVLVEQVVDSKRQNRVLVRPIVG